MAKCLSSGAADYWVRPLRASEARVLWTRLKQVSAATALLLQGGLPAAPRSARLLGAAVAAAVGWLGSRRTAAAAAPMPAVHPTVAHQPAPINPLPMELLQESHKGSPAGDDTGSGSGNSSDAAAT